MRYRRVKCIQAIMLIFVPGKQLTFGWSSPSLFTHLKLNIMTERTLILSNPYNRRAIAPATANTSMERLMNVLIKKFDSLIDKFYQYTVG
jgi:hypothetical protein